MRPSGEHRQGARDVPLLDPGRPKFLSGQPVHLHRQHVGQRRVAVTARSETVVTAQRDQSFTPFNLGGQLPQARLPPAPCYPSHPGCTRRNCPAQTRHPGTRAILAQPAGKPLEVQVHIGRRIDGPANELLLLPGLPLQVQHAQAPFKHGQERGQLVVLGHQFARLLARPQGQPILTWFSGERS